MVSRRNYFSIIVMMAVLFFMFQFSQIIKDSGNRYDVNAYAVSEEDLPTGEDKWEPDKDMVSFEEDGYVLLIGKEESKLGEVVTQWCNYTKQVMKVTTINEYEKTKELPKLILVDSLVSDIGSKSVMLEQIMELGAPVVFCNLPAVEDIENNSKLQEMLGIREIRAQETQVKGIHLFEGLLLGGEAIYEATTAKEQERQDMDLTVPWYVMGSGTKTYMVGIKDKDKVKNEEFPALIWRNTYNDTKVFAVEGEYMSTLAGLGLLSAFTYELESYEIYPVVNARNVTIANFPGFSEENAEELSRLYSRSPKMIFRDIMWPSISAMTETNNLKLTCMFNPQFDYDDGIEPEPEAIVFYLQQLKELRSEAGISLKYKDIEFEEMLKQDEAFYQATGNQYQYQAVYVEEQDLKNVKAACGKGLLSNTKTLVGSYQQGMPLVSYLTKDVTVQNVTGNAKEYTYGDDFTDRGILSAIGYSNVLLDLQAAVWPQEVEDEWQNLYDTMSSNVRTYWPGEGGFEETTLSESDMRIRTFLNLDYEDARSGDIVVLKVSNRNQPTWFLLRTHDEKIESISGGEFQRLEKDAYLIKVLEDTVTIELEQLSLQEQSVKN